MILGFDEFGATKKSAAQKVIILHDWFSDHSSYTSAKPYFNTTDFHYAFPDLRGYGLSKNKIGQYTLAEAAQDILDTADHLGWTQFHLVGHSMTALIGQFICALARQRVQSFVAITPVGATGTPNVPKDVRHFMTQAAQDNDDFASQAAHMMTGNRYGQPWIDFKVQAWRKTSTSEARVGYMHMFLDANVLSETQGMDVPMTVLCGAQDAEGYRKDVMDETFMKWYPNCSVFELQGSGHYPMQEIPPAFATTLMTALAPAATQT